MPCIPDSYGGFRESGYSFRNWLGNVNTSVQTYFEPDSLESLVWVVNQAHTGGHRLRVVGSGWSFENIAACPDWMVRISNLNRIISHFTDEALTAASPLTLEWQRRITRPGNITRLVHVEAGIRLFELNQQLHDRGLALPTLGGSQGQLLAGAISTSTHGGDVRQPPLADIVRAVHLVTKEGQELWVESSSQPLTHENDIAARLSCGDVQIIRDDELLSALQVSVGRFGIIYSYVLEVRTRFDLVEWATPSSWSEVSSFLREGITEGNILVPLLSNLPLPAIPPDGPSSSVFAGIPFEDASRPRYLEFLINSRNGNQLWVRRRWERERADLELEVPVERTEFINEHTVANWILVSAARAIRLIAIPAILPIPGYREVRHIEMEVRALELDGYAHDPHVSADFALTASLNALWACDDLGVLGLAIDELARIVFDGRSELAKTGKRGVSWQIMSNLSADPGPNRVNSIEIIFDATTSSYIDFIDFLTVEGHGHRQSGYISVRFSSKSNALLSMHNVESSLAVSVEVASIQGFEHNDRWMRLIESRAIELGGRPHWGQHNNLQAYQVNRLYGEKVQRWREQLVRVVDSTNTFSNNYTEQRGLEPVGIIRYVTAVRRAAGRITHLCNPDAYWSPMPVEEVIRAFESDHPFVVGSSAFPPALGRINYIVRTGDESVPDARVIVAHVLTTSPDDTVANNLDSLGVCRELYLRIPPADQLRRRVTSVTRNRWGGVTALCNDDEQWRVLDSVAFFEISRGDIEYFIDRGGVETILLAKTHVTTFADGIAENNLSSLPEG